MVKLPAIFSDGAVFQHSAKFTLNGRITDGTGVVCVILENKFGKYSEETCFTDDNGFFSLDISTPVASFDEYSVAIFFNNEEYRINNILFGEVWLASGQSNMELPNRFMLGRRELYSKIVDKNIRFFDQEQTMDIEMPYTPSDERAGRWITAEDARIDEISAVATFFSLDLYDRINDVENDIPVAILNISTGASAICQWIPRNVLLSDEYIRDWMERHGQHITSESWTLTGEDNFQQPAALYNTKIYPLLGFRFRGIIWYQGEADVFSWDGERVYKRFLQMYYTFYRKTFAAYDDNFKMICSLLFPWPYGRDGDTVMNAVNTDMIKCAEKSPDCFAVVPVADLPPVWALASRPIHPTNKYEIGKRMSMIAATSVYGKKGQLSPAFPKKVKIVGKRIIIQFTNVGSGLRISGERPRCLYISSEDMLYLPAKCELLSCDTMAVWNDNISEPISCAYAYQSFETFCNIFAGDYPVIPFCTEGEKTYTERLPLIHAKPWLYPDVDSVWTYNIRNNGSDSILDLYMHPVWRPDIGTEICRDNTFTRSGCSIRICAADTDGSGIHESYGMYTLGCIGNMIDLKNYSLLCFDAYSPQILKAKLRVCLQNKIEQIDGTVVGEIDIGWKRFEFNLDRIVDDEISRIELVFENPNSEYKSVNVENFELVPRIDLKNNFEKQI